MRAAFATGGRPDVPTLEEQALYHNLWILGIVSSSLKQEGIELTRTTFRRSNNKALEYVLYRLYSIIEGKARAQKDFKGMLPVLDKVQQAPFYQRIGDWMMELKKSGRLEPSVILPVSALKTNTSNRLVLLLLELSSVAMQQDLEATCPGATQAAYLPSAGSAAAGAGVGLLEDSLIPGEARLAVSVTRTKQACSEFLACIASSSSICDAMEQRSLAFKKRYYELQAEIRQQDAVRAESTEATQVPAAGSSSSPRSMLGSPTSSAAAARSGSGVLLGPAAAAAAAAAGAGGNMLFEASSMQADGSAAGAAQQGTSRGDPLGTRPDPESPTTLSLLLVGLEEHLRVHQELSKALMTDGVKTDFRGSGTDGSFTSRSAAGFANGGGLRFGQPQQQQVLHPYQIDGKALAAELLVAASAAQDAMGRGGGFGFDQSQRRQQGVKYGPDNIVPAFMSFSSMLSTLAPHVTQLAMAGENAGPPPLLQPTSHPSGHAAHVAHQLQVHGNASRQIVQLSRKVQEQAAAYGPVLRRLRQESSRAIASRYELPPQDSLDDDFLDVGPHLALPPALTQPVRQLNGAFTAAVLSSPKPGPAVAAAHLPGATTATSSGAPSVIVMGSPCASSASAYMGPAVGSAGASAGAAAPAASVVTSTTGVPVAAGQDTYQKLQDRLRSLQLGKPALASSHAAAAAGGGSVPVSATSAKAAAGTAAANIAMGMFSPSAIMYGIGSSPMAMSTGPFSASARPPMSATAQASYEYTMASMQAAAAAVSTSTTAMSPLRSTQRPQEAPLGFNPAPQTHENRIAAETSTATMGADEFASGGSTSNWPHSFPLLGGAASGISAGASAAPPALASEATRQQPYQDPVLGWTAQQALRQTMHEPSSRSALGTQLVQQQQTQSQLRHLHGGTAAADGAFPVALSDGLLHAAPAGGGSGGSATGTGSAAQHPQRLPQSLNGGRRVEGSDFRGDIPARSGWGAAACGVSTGPAPFFSTAAAGGHAHAESAMPAAASGGGPVSSGDSRRVDLRTLLDDDEDDARRGLYNGNTAADAHPPDSPSRNAPAGGFSGHVTGFGATDSDAAAQAEPSSSHLADSDADFGRLAAESEMLSQVLMFGGATGSALLEPPPHHPTGGAGLTAVTFGTVPEVTSSAWGSGAWGVAMECGEVDRSFAAMATASHSARAAAVAFGAVDVDNGDDVVMADNDKDASPGAVGAKGASAGWPAAGTGVGVVGSVSGRNQVKGSMFDAFGALVSPQQQQAGGGLPRLDYGQAVAAVAEPPQPVQSSTRDADLQALRARVQAALSKN